VEKKKCLLRNSQLEFIREKNEELDKIMKRRSVNDGDIDYKHRNDNGVINSISNFVVIYQSKQKKRGNNFPKIWAKKSSIIP
jgi:hypothetical protein